jgi:hypothetical protein
VLIVSSLWPTAPSRPALALVGDGLAVEPAAALVDLARGGDRTGFRALAERVGIPTDAVATLWTLTRRRLGGPATGRTSTEWRREH